MYTQIRRNSHHCSKCGCRVKYDATSCNYCGAVLTPGDIRDSTRYEESLAVIFLVISIITLLEAINANPLRNDAVDTIQIARWILSLIFYVISIITVVFRRFPLISIGCLLIASLLSVPDYYGIAGLFIAIPLWMSRSAFLLPKSSFKELDQRNDVPHSVSDNPSNNIVEDDDLLNNQSADSSATQVSNTVEDADECDNESKKLSSLIELIPFLLFIALVIFALILRS